MRCKPWPAFSGTCYHCPWGVCLFGSYLKSMLPNHAGGRKCLSGGADRWDYQPFVNRLLCSCSCYFFPLFYLLCSKFCMIPCSVQFGSWKSPSTLEIPRRKLHLPTVMILFHMPQVDMASYGYYKNGTAPSPGKVLASCFLALRSKFTLY